MDAALRKRGLRLASNQIEFSLLRTMPLRVGLIGTCRELGVVPLAYSPIGQGRLTGKYSAANPPPRGRTFSAHPMERGGRSRWPCCAASARPTTTAPRARSRWPGSSPRARCPIPGAKNRAQAEQNAGALGWRMTDEELARPRLRPPSTANGASPSAFGSTADTRRYRLEVIAALVDAGLPPLQGSQFFSTQFDFVPVAMIVVALALYLWGVRRNNALHPRHPWSVGKTAAWIGALVAPPGWPSSASSASTTASCSGTTWSSTCC